MLQLNENSTIQVINASSAYEYDSFISKTGKEVKGGVTWPVFALVDDVKGKQHFIKLKLTPAKLGDVIEKGMYKIKGLDKLPFYEMNERFVHQTKIDLDKNPITELK